MATLLDLFTPQQQRLVDVVADAFIQDNEWPVFDYLTGSFDEPTENAAEIVASFPRFGRWNYGAVWWIGIGQISEPTREEVVGLTVLGAPRSASLHGLDVFFDVIALMISRWRTTPVSTRQARELKITDEDVAGLLKGERRLDTEHWPLRLYKLMEQREVPLNCGEADLCGDARDVAHSSFVGSFPASAKSSREHLAPDFSLPGSRSAELFIKKPQVRVDADPQFIVCPPAGRTRHS